MYCLGDYSSARPWAVTPAHAEATLFIALLQHPLGLKEKQVLDRRRSSEDYFRMGHRNPECTPRVTGSSIHESSLKRPLKRNKKNTHFAERPKEHSGRKRRGLVDHDQAQNVRGRGENQAAPTSAVLITRDNRPSSHEGRLFQPTSCVMGTSNIGSHPQPHRIHNISES